MFLHLFSSTLLYDVFVFMVLLRFTGLLLVVAKSLKINVEIVIFSKKMLPWSRHLTAVVRSPRGSNVTRSLGNRAQGGTDGKYDVFITTVRDKYTILSAAR